ncbi:MAG TPA: SH3 domain-containing protein, partial [Allosphingosinicella sp.]|nr:SH3 domain-containing protein [Allosphingosinicella sp.]
MLSLAPAEAQRTRQPPYMASIASGEAMMRTGPGRNYPGTWLYVRRDLPIRVLEVYREWRRIQDPDGTTGWMLVALLSDQRSAIVRGSAPRPMHEAPDEASPVRFRAAPGVVGRVSRCAGGWCRFD